MVLDKLGERAKRPKHVSNSIYQVVLCHKQEPAHGLDLYAFHLGRSGHDGDDLRQRPSLWIYKEQHRTTIYR